MTKEHPILFSAPMVRAILSGTKTQTRRVVKTRKCPDFGCELAPGEIAGDAHPERLCPYGQPGDLLWVRESWRADGAFDAIPPRDIPPGSGVEFEADQLGGVMDGKLRPGMFMPRWASRITLEITGVRVERLQSIREADAQAEGATLELGELEKLILGAKAEYRSGFARLWESINGPESWAANPWAWVVEFKRAA